MLATIPELAKARQLIVIKSFSWTSPAASVEWFERTDAGDWKRKAGPFPAGTGRNGLRWGLGLHGGAPAGTTGKREGDGCSPAGVFELDTVFGTASESAASFLKMPYTVATSDLEGVDDPSSRYYNRLVHRGKVSPDWKTSEPIAKTGELYRWGVMVRHNWNQEPGYGSCFFLHIWPGAKISTPGCTSFAADDVTALVHWLDRREGPVLVQLPKSEYAARQKAWRLP